MDSYESIEGVYTEGGEAPPREPLPPDDGLTYTERTEAPAEEPPPASDFEPIPGVSSFPERWKADFEGLTYMGFLEDIVTIPAHKILISTLLPSAKLEVALICKEFEGTLGYNRAYKSAIVAASVKQVDGRPISPAIRESGNATRYKFNYVTNSWYDPVIDYVYKKVDALEARQVEVMRELGLFAEDGEGKGGS